MPIYVINQLPVDERYTKSWYQYFYRHPHFFPLGDDKSVSLDRSKRYNYFSNLSEAIRYETDQVDKAISLAEQGVLKYLLIADLDYPGIASAVIPPLRLINPAIHISGILHAGTWCEGDLFKDMKAKVWHERTALMSCDKVMVATEYHCLKICDYFSKFYDNLHIIGGLPLDVDELITYRTEKVNDIMLVGRREQIDTSYLNDGYLMLTEPIKRSDYLHLLARHKVAIIPKVEETFGYSAIEALCVGTIPLVPDGFAFRETIPDAFRYRRMSDLPDMIHTALSGGYAQVLDAYDPSFYEYRNILDRIADIILSQGAL